MISLIQSQSILSLISKGLTEPINGKYIKRIEKLISTNSWLKKCRIHVIIDEKPDAMAYSLFRISRLKLKLVNEIIITTALIDLVNDDELEAILAHEYAHIKEYHSIYSNVLTFISSIFFFIPLFKSKKNLIWQKNELKADELAVELIMKPLSLARALVKIYFRDYKLSVKKTKRSSSNPPIPEENSHLLHRVNNLINYAQEYQLDI
ncbi:MAG: M56 family metallopeptidase [Candidatus Heimdallarchaeota archaeon]|nr:M56 family metallopeptidase [Candidatus Heimdallarchaeota archaeon]